MTAAALSQRESLAARYSSRHPRAAASSNWFNIAPAPAVASCQKLISRPQTPPASSTGKIFTQFFFSGGWQSHGSNSTERASIPSVKAPQSAKNMFSPAGIHAAGKTRNGNVTSHVTG